MLKKLKNHPSKSVFSILLNHSGHKLVEDPIKEVELNFSRNKMKITVYTIKNKKFEFPVNFEGISYNSELYTKDKTLSFVSKNYINHGSYAYEILLPLYPSKHLFMGKLKITNNKTFLLTVEFEEGIQLNIIRTLGKWNNSFWQ